MRALFAILLAISLPMFAAGSDGLIGTWKVVSWQVIVENEPPQNVFGSNPKGYLVLTREGRSIVVTTADNRKSGMGVAERAARSAFYWRGRRADVFTPIRADWKD